MKIFTLLFAVIMLLSTATISFAADASVGIITPGGADQGEIEEVVIPIADEVVEDIAEENVVVDKEQFTEEPEIMLIDSSTEDAEESSDTTLYIILAVLALVGGFAFGSILKK